MRSELYLRCCFCNRTGTSSIDLMDYESGMPLVQEMSCDVEHSRRRLTTHSTRAELARLSFVNLDACFVVCRPVNSSVRLLQVREGKLKKFRYLKGEGTLFMVKMVEMDEAVTLQQQMMHEVRPVILINKFNVNPDDVNSFLAAWAADAAFFKQQPGFISTQLHRGIGGSCVFINYAVWESVAHFRRALSQPEFHEALKNYPPSAVGSPHLFEKVAVPNICVA